MKIILNFALLLLVITTQAQTKKNKPTSSKPKAAAKSKTSVNAGYIVGTWTMIQMPTGDGMSQDQTWTFTKNFFAVEGYPELKQKGMYKIMKEKGDTLFLKLYKQEGHWGTEDKEQKIIINKAAAKIRIDWLEFRKKD